MRCSSSTAPANTSPATSRSYPRPSASCTCRPVARNPIRSTTSGSPCARTASALESSIRMPPSSRPAAEASTALAQASDIIRSIASRSWAAVSVQSRWHQTPPAGTRPPASFTAAAMAPWRSWALRDRHAERGGCPRTRYRSNQVWGGGSRRGPSPLVRSPVGAGALHEELSISALHSVGHIAGRDIFQVSRSDKGLLRQSWYGRLCLTTRTNNLSRRRKRPGKQNTAPLPWQPGGSSLRLARMIL